MRLIIAAGGTGGHIYPAIAIANEITKQNKNVRLLFVGNRRGMEEKIVKSAGYNFTGITAGGIKGKNLFKTITGLIKIAIGCFESINIFFTFRPNLVLGMGGYVSVPVIIISILFAHPFILHEQNSVPGLVNRIFSRLAKKVLISFEETREYLDKKYNCILTGNPVREEFIKVTKESSAAISLNLNNDKTTLLFLGGSQGAHSINSATLKFIDIVKESGISNLQIIWITGVAEFETMCRRSSNLESVYSKVVIYPFMKNIWDAYSISKLVISRSGATTIAEITTIGIPSILIPFSKAIYDHQMKNAQILFKNGASVVLCDETLTGEILFKTVFDILNNDGLLIEMGNRARELSKSEAAKNISKEILGIV